MEFSKDWQRLVSFASQDDLLGDASVRRDALGLARKIMGRARSNVDRILSGLAALNYEFARPDHAHVAPPDDALDWLEELESYEIFLPITLQAWVLEVGSVNFTGNCPDWPADGYWAGGDRETWLTDPLVVEVTRESVDYWYQEWSEIEEDCPFQLTFAPDILHKSNISGGPSYCLEVSHRRVDSLVLNESKRVSFLAHVQQALSWGGFPGIEQASGGEHHGLLSNLRAKLEVL